MKIKHGITGNYYCYSNNKNDIIRICDLIGKSINSIYWNKKHEVYCIRIKNKKQKEILKNVYA